MSDEPEPEEGLEPELGEFESGGELLEPALGEEPDPELGGAPLEPALGEEPDPELGGAPLDPALGEEPDPELGGAPPAPVLGEDPDPELGGELPAPVLGEDPDPESGGEPLEPAPGGQADPELGGEALVPELGEEPDAGLEDEELGLELLEPESSVDPSLDWTSPMRSFSSPSSELRLSSFPFEAPVCDDGPDAEDGEPEPADPEFGAVSLDEEPPRHEGGGEAGGGWLEFAAGAPPGDIFFTESPSLVDRPDDPSSMSPPGARPDLLAARPPILRHICVSLSATY